MTDRSIYDRCSVDFAYRELSGYDKSEEMKDLYKDTESVLESYYYMDLDMTSFFIDPKSNKQCWVRDNIDFARYGLTWDEAARAVYAVYEDHPLFYYVDRYKVGGNPDKGLITPVLDYEYIRGDIRRLYTERIEEEIASSMEKIHLNKDRDEAKTVYDFIKSRASYDYLKANTNYIDTPAHSIIGYVRNRSAVCEGLSQTFQVFMNYLGIKTITVSGFYIKDEGTLEPHSRNFTYLNDERRWIMIDMATGTATKTDNGFDILKEECRFRRRTESEKTQEPYKYLTDYEEIWRSYLE